MAIPASFQKAEDEFFILKGKLQTGRITRAEFDAALKGLMVQDPQGRYWTIGADSGKWLVHDGAAWVEAPLPGGAMPQAPLPPPPGSAVFFAQPAAPAPARSSNTVLLAVGAIIVLCLLGGVAGLAIMGGGLLKLGVAAPTNTPFVVFVQPTASSIPVVAAPPTAVPPTLAAPTLAAPTLAAPTLAAPTLAAPTLVPPTALPPKPTDAITAAVTLTPTVQAAAVSALNDLLAQADALTFQSKFAEANALYERAVQTDPIAPLAHARWSRMLLWQADLEKRDELYALALKKAEAAFTLAPTDGEAATRLSRAYDWNGTFDKALTAAKNATLLAPNSAEAYAVLSEAYLDNKNQAEAETAARKAIQLDPNSAEGHRSLALVFRAKNQIEASLAELEKAGQLEPNLAERQCQLGSHYREAKNYVKALAAYERALTIYPQSTKAYLGLGSAAFEQKQYDQAASYFEKAVGANPAYADAHYSLGISYYLQDNCVQAKPAFAKSIELNPRANVAMTFLGWCELKAGNTAAAGEWAKKSSALNANNADTRALVAALAPGSNQTTEGRPAAQYPPGLYVSSVQVDPPEPKDRQTPTFKVTFLNTFEQPINVRWFVKIYEPEGKQSFGETAKLDSSVPVGTTTIDAVANWRAVGGNPCRQFIARIFSETADKTVLEFPKPGGDSVHLYFSVCPAN